MEGLGSYQSYVTIGHETSFEAAKKQVQSIACHAGQKRTLEQFEQCINASSSHARQDFAHQQQPVLQNVFVPSSIVDFDPRRPSPTSKGANGGSNGPGAPAVSVQDSRDPLLSLAHPTYQLPYRLVSNFASLGVNLIYEWQSRCLTQSGLLEGRDNLIYTAPTGGGKSLVADVLMLKRIIQNSRSKAIVVLPFVALVQEKLRWYRKLVEGVSKALGDPTASPAPSWKQPHTSSIRVAGFFGGSRAMIKFADIDIAVCTIEKANSLVNSAIEEGYVDQLGTVIIDEFHMIDDEHRGYLIELMVTKLLCLNSGLASMQIIGMSATLSVSEVEVFNSCLS